MQSICTLSPSCFLPIVLVQLNISYIFLKCEEISLTDLYSVRLHLTPTPAKHFKCATKEILERFELKKEKSDVLTSGSQLLQFYFLRIM